MKRLAFAPLIAVACCLMPAGAFAGDDMLYELAAALANKSVPIEITTATTTELIAAPATLNPAGGVQAVNVTAADVVADGTGNIQFVTGTKTSTPCDTGATNVTGNYHFTAQTGFTKGSGDGPVWILPAGQELCAVTSAAVGMHGSVSYRVK
jgi:hypothetical protein